MATRGSYGFFEPTKDGRGYFKLAFQHCDSGPWELGTNVLNFIHGIRNNSYKLKKLKDQIENVSFNTDIPDDQWKLYDDFLNNVLAGKVKFYEVGNFNEGGYAHEYCWAIDPWNKTLTVYTDGGEDMVEIPWKTLPKAWPEEITHNKERFMEYCHGLTKVKAA